MHELIENDADHSDLTEKLDWYMLSIVNPDGYAYTQYDRFWRKTRWVLFFLNQYDMLKNILIFVRSPNSACSGTDANRNWGYHWNDGGSSNNGCSDTYHGSEAFSEVENR